MARDRILFEFHAPPIQQRGRILWIFANPYTDLIAGPYGLDILNGISREHGYQTLLVNPFLDYLDPIQGLREVIKSLNRILSVFLFAIWMMRSLFIVWLGMQVQSIPRTCWEVFKL